MTPHRVMYNALSKADYKEFCQLKMPLHLCVSDCTHISPRNLLASMYRAEALGNWGTPRYTKWNNISIQMHHGEYVK